MDFVAGVCLLNLVLLILAFICPLSITWHYAAVCIAAGILLIHFYRWGTLAAYPWKLEIFVLAFSFIAISGIIYYTLSFYTISEKEVHFTAYVDVFLHASILAPFSNNPIALGNRWVLGMPLTFYHYAAYMIPALFCRLSGSSALNTVVGFMIPLGFLMVAAAAFVAARKIWSTAAGLAAVWVLLTVPDSSVLPTSHAHLSFFTYVHIAPTMTYAIAQALIAFLLLQQGLKTRRNRCIGFALFLSASLFLIKAHFVLFVLPVNVAYTVLKYPGLGVRRRCLLLGFVSMLGIITLIAGYALMPQYGKLGTFGTSAYVAYLCKNAQSQNIFFILLRGVNPENLRTVLGFFFILLATFGLLLPWYSVTILWKWRAERLTLDDMLPAVYILIYGLVLTLFPLCTTGDPFEFHHRPHVFVYAWMAFYCAGQTISLFAQTSLWANRLWIRITAVMVLLSSLLVPWITKDHYQNRCHATRLRGNYSIPRGLWDCARFIRSASRPEDVYVDSVEDPKGLTTGITERRALVAYTFMTDQLEEFQNALRRNRSIHTALCGATNQKSLWKIAHEYGIRWYLFHPEDPSVQWPDEVLRNPVFSSQGYRVYDLYNLAP